LLAFFADLELRRSGERGLLQLIADLLEEADRELALPRIRGWMEANGLEDFHARYVVEPARFPDLDPVLEQLGFELTREKTGLTYLGIQVEGDATTGRVAAVDPGGPAARAGIKVGDRIAGFSPKRSRPPRIDDSVRTPFRFGLDRIASGADVAELDVLRDGIERKIRVEVRLVPGGVRTAYRAATSALDEFFRFDPPRPAR
jgi:hypothetical protein